MWLVVIGATSLSLRLTTNTTFIINQSQQATSIVCENLCHIHLLNLLKRNKYGQLQVSGGMLIQRQLLPRLFRLELAQMSLMHSPLMDFPGHCTIVLLKVLTKMITILYKY